jgi:hypothetical protein
VRYRFEPTDDGRVDVIEPGGAAACWLPGGIAGEIEAAYAAQRERDWVVANQWMAGVLVGIHASLAFGNQRPEVEMDIRRGITRYRMGEPPRDSPSSSERQRAVGRDK